LMITPTPSSIRLLPDTRYYNYVRKRRSIDPTRFDYWHPQIGALIGMEISGIPTTVTKIVSVNAHFNVNADRSAWAANPQQFDTKQPILGALFHLERHGSSQTNLLPDTAYYAGQRSLYESDPAKYQLKNVYLGAIFAIEDFEQGVSNQAPITAVNESASAARTGSANPPATANPGHGKTGHAGSM
jgi:hypothetical protein